MGYFFFGSGKFAFHDSAESIIKYSESGFAAVEKLCYWVFMLLLLYPIQYDASDYFRSNLITVVIPF